mgnify:CR=1 FL=1
MGKTLYNYTGLTEPGLKRLKRLVACGERGLGWRALYAGWFGLRHTFESQCYVTHKGDRRVATDRAREVVAQYGWLVP